MATRFVIDVGSGGRPHPEANLLVDKYLDQVERGSPLRRAGYPFILADAEQLPFKDKSARAVYASHCLEHCTNPGQALEELIRVGESGFVETPAPLIERLYRWKYHKWLVKWERGKLKFSPNPHAAASFPGHKIHSEFVAWRLFIRALDLATGGCYVRGTWSAKFGEGQVIRVNRMLYYLAVFKTGQWAAPLALLENHRLPKGGPGSRQ